MIDFLSKLNSLDGLFQLVSTLLWGAYVYYTVRTFKEIHRQTELQSAASLLVSFRRHTGSPPERAERIVVEKVRQLHEKWRDILSKNVPTALGSDTYIILTLNNNGRSEIVNWHIDIHLDIEPAPFLQNNMNISGESSDWRVSYQGYQDIIFPGKAIDIPIAYLFSFVSRSRRWSPIDTPTQR